MIRCNNCGWENPDHNTKCEKCNAPLQSGVSYQPAHPVAASEQNLNKTVNEFVAFPEVPSSHICPNCSYPLREGASVCPNCGHGTTTKEPQGMPQVQPAQVYQHPNAVKGTVNPWVQVAPQNKCTLTPVKQNSETETPAPHQFKGDSHELNRGNLDAENMTITSNIQAVLNCENGQWYIEDKSAQHTTFVYVGRKTPVKNGDIILMGNRQFIFTEDK